MLLLLFFYWNFFFFAFHFSSSYNVFFVEYKKKKEWLFNKVKNGWLFFSSFSISIFIYSFVFKLFNFLYKQQQQLNKNYVQIFSLVVLLVLGFVFFCIFLYFWVVNFKCKLCLTTYNQTGKIKRDHLRYIIGFII